MIEQRTTEWFKQRMGRITASSVGAILGFAPYQTKKDVMKRMIREYQGLDAEFKGNVATEYGTFNEAGAISEFKMETGLDVISAPFVIRDDWLGASPDGFVSDGSIIEVKCPFGMRNGGEFKSIMDQKHYYAQIQLQLYCTELNRCYFFQWCPTSTKLEVVEYDHDFTENMLEQALVFYHDYLELRNKPIEFDNEDINLMMTDYLELKNKKILIEENMKNLLAGMIALTDNIGGTIGGHKLYKTERAGSISYSKVVADHLKDIDLEPYRGAKTEFWSIK